MTAKSERDRNRRLEREIERLRSKPGMEPLVEETLERMEHDPYFGAKVGRLLAKGLKLSARRADAGRTGGIMAARKLTAQQRITRAHKGGLTAFYRGGNASTYGKYLVDRREKKRRSH